MLFFLFLICGIFSFCLPLFWPYQTNRNQRSGGKNASSDRTPVVDKGLSTATNSVQPSFLGPRSISATTGSSNSIISNNNNNNNAAAAAISNLK